MPSVRVHHHVRYHEANALWAIFLWSLAAWPVRAQTPVPVDRIAEAIEEFNHGSGRAAIKCEFHPSPAKLDFGLRFESGYELLFPLEQFDGAAHEIEILLKVNTDPLSGEPLFLSDRSRLVNGQAGKKADGQITGRFAVEPGVYRIDALATDETGRACRAQWKLDVRPGPLGKADVSGALGSRTTVFLDAAPTIPNASSLQPADVALLTDTLSALVDRLAPQPMRLVVFNMDLENELLRVERFTRSDVERVRTLLASLQLGTVDVHALRERVGRPAFVAALIRNENIGNDPSRRIVFLGAYANPTERAPKVISSEKPLATLSYLQYRERRQSPEAFMPSLVTAPPSPEYGASEYPVPAAHGPIRFERRQIPWGDTIEQVVRQAGGRTIVFTTPEEFSSALNHITSASPR